VTTLHIVVDDPDATIDSCMPLEQYGDDSPSTTCHEDCRPKAGTWTPVIQPGHLELDFTHVYAAAGTYTAKFGFKSGDCAANSAYGSYGEGTATVVVN
jgi:hypothetical protein